MDGMARARMRVTGTSQGLFYYTNREGRAAELGGRWTRIDS